MTWSRLIGGLCLGADAGVITWATSDSSTWGIVGGIIVLVLSWAHADALVALILDELSDL